jgi:hypothetical protein
VSVLRKLGRTRTDGSSLLGAGAGGAAGLPFFLAENKTVLSATTQDVVEIALYASLSSILGVSQSSGSTASEKMLLLSRATIQGRGVTRYVEGLAGAEGSVRNGSRKEMIVAVAPASFTTRSQFIVVSARDHGRHVSKKECTTWVMWLIASKLIRGKETF